MSGPSPETKSEVIASAAGAIENSRWRSRIIMLCWALGAQLVILAAAILLDKPQAAVNTMGGLVVVSLVLAVVTPSAEQLSKMLAQVAAIRFGVGKVREEHGQ